MAEARFQGLGFILITVVLGLVLGLIPLPTSVPAELNYLRPDWLGLILAYWLLATPEQMSVVAAFWIGLVADIVFGAPFGFHGLNYVLLAALVLSSYQQLRMLEIWQQALLILFALELLTVLQLVMVGVIDDRDQSWLILLRPLTSALVWPWVFLLLRAYRRRYV